MQAIMFKPVAFYPLGSAAPYSDYSGYGNSGTQSGTSAKGIALVSNVEYSRQFRAGVEGTFVAPVYIDGRESASFSITAVIYPILGDNNTEQQIASHGTAFDGITLEGTTIHFTTLYENEGAARCSYDLGAARRADVVATHTEYKNSLYVDSVLVAEVDITSLQRKDSYNISSSVFKCGYTTGDQRVLVNNLGFFSRTLRAEEITALFRYNARRATGSVPRTLQGVDMLVGTNARQPYLNIEWKNESDWQSGSLYNTVIENDILGSTRDSIATTGGYWMDAIDLYAGSQPLAIDSLDLWWESKNATVEASLDGTTWTPAVRGQRLSVIPQGFDPTNKSLFIRVLLAAGQDESHISYLRARAHIGDEGLYQNRVVEYTNAIVFDEATPAELPNEWGVVLNNGSITIKPDAISEIPMDVRTVEVWMKKSTSTNPTLSANLSGATSYINGVAGSSQIANEWAVRHFVSASPITTDIVISGDVQIGKVAFYPTSLSALQVAQVTSNYTGVAKTSYSGSGTIGITEPADSTVIYAHEWAIYSL